MENNPLIMVCYTERDVIEQKEIMVGMAEHLNQTISERGANIMALFVPTDGDNRIECINPILATPDQKEKIDHLIGEISKSFDIGQGADDDLDEDYDSSVVKPFKN